MRSDDDVDGMREIARDEIRLDPESARFRRVEALFVEALRKPDREREAWLRTVESDASVRADAARLLAIDAASADAASDAAAAGDAASSDLAPIDSASIDARIERAVAATAARAVAARADDARAALRDDVFDGWRLDEKLGEGGMGAVYAARPASGDGPRVAIKVLRDDVEAASLVARFESERRILATLSHPGIARLLDAGRTRSGRPFLVLEYVEGEAIDAYCDRHRLDARARVALMRQVCDAVQNAHRNLVVHRDLKPSNVLVAQDGAVKLLDFGIAKLLRDDAEPPRDDDTLGTVTRLGWMTPTYASPEQILGEPVRPASDVYSLGVLLYRLLTGVSPYRDTASHPTALARAIVELDPPTASARVRANADAREARRLADVRRATPASLARALSGDVDVMLAKALAKEPDRRYGTAGELAADLGRWLDGLPISARPATLRYRAGKFLRRHRVASALTAAFALSVVAFVIVSLTLLAQTRAERDRATQTTALLTDLFEIAEPGPAQGNAITARALLDRGAERAALRFKDQPQSNAEFLGMLGGLYQQLGIYDRAADSLRKSIELQRARTGTRSVEVADLTNQLARVYAANGDFRRAEPLFRESLEVRRALLPADDERVWDAVNNLALINHDLGRYAQAEALYLEVVADPTRAGSARDPDGSTLGNLALLYADTSRYAESERAYRDVLRLRTALYGAEHPETAYIEDELSMTLSARGAHAEARTLALRALVNRRKTFGDRHRDTARSLAHLGALARARGETAEAERLQRAALASRIALLGEDHAEVAESRLELGLTLLDLDRIDEAGDLLRKARDAHAIAVGADHPLQGRPLYGLARWSASTGDCAAAARYANEALKLLPDLDPRRAELSVWADAAGGGAVSASLCASRPR